MRPGSVLLWVVSAVFLAGCATDPNYGEKRRQTLLEIYPVRKTTKADVRKRWPSPPATETKRPPGGWATCPDPWVRSYTVKAEQRIGKTISSAERYYGADGMFSLCHCWFYYDSRDRLIDAEWQWSSD